MPQDLIGTPPIRGTVDDIGADGQIVKVSTNWSTWFTKVFQACFSIYQSGTTAERPTTNLWVGRSYFDTTLGVKVWYDGATWVVPGLSGGQNTFTTIAVSGQSDIVADSASDTLTVAAGSKISITTNAATDTLTIATTGAAASGSNTDITSVLLNQTGLVVKGGSSNALTIKPNETLSVGRTLSVITGDSDRSLTLTGDASISGTHTGTSSGTNTGDQTSVSGNAGTATALQNARNIDGQSFDGTANITIIAPGTHAATSKSTPVDADELPLVDSAASNVLKKLTWSNLKATLKAYFDTLYAPSGSNTPILITTLTASSSSALTDTTSLTSTYTVYKLELCDLLPATDNVSLKLRMGEASGGIDTSSSYIYAYGGKDNGGTDQGNSSAGDSSISLTSAIVRNITARSGVSGTITISNPTNTTHRKNARFHLSEGSSAYWVGEGTDTSSAVTNANLSQFSVFFSSGNITSGYIKVWGYP